MINKRKFYFLTKDMDCMDEYVEIEKMIMAAFYSLNHLGHQQMIDEIYYVVNRKAEENFENGLFKHRPDRISRSTIANTITMVLRSQTPLHAHNTAQLQYNFQPKNNR